MENQQEQINQLLDGELDTMMEQSLYGRLAVDAELRAEMREQLAMRLAIQEDRALLVPPAALTNNVFSGLGFAAPLAGAAAGAAGGSMLTQWLSRLGIPIASALAATGLTIALSNGGAPSSSQVAQTTSVVAGQTPSAPILPEKITTVNEVPTTPTMRTVYVTDPHVREQLALLEAENNRLRAELANRPTVEVSTSETTVQQHEQPRLAEVRLVQAYSPQRTADVQPYAVQALRTAPSTEFLPGVSLQVRGFSLNALQSTQAPEQSDWYSNLGLSFLYRFSNNHSAGIELGNESFPMIFQGDRNGQVIQYEQFPTAFWVGATYRFTGNSFSAFPAAPYAQATLAGSQFGPIGRVAGGIQYTPLGPVSFLLGVEAASLAYSFQNQWYFSPKVGLTYGMAVRF